MRTKCEARKQAIIDVAREVFDACGFGSASMSQIAARLGGSKATLYNYFTSKEELFGEVTRRFAADNFCTLFSVLDPEADVAAALKEFGQRFLSIVCRPDVIAVHRNVFAESGKSEVGKYFYEHGPQKGLNSMSEYLAQCMALGKLRQADSYLAAQQLIALLKAETMDRHLLGVQESVPADELPDIAARAVDTFMLAYRAS